MYQLAKLRMLELYYDFLDKYFSRQDFDLCYMDTDSFYFAMSGDSLDEIFKPGKSQAYMRLTRKTGLQQTNLAREHLGYLSLNFLVQEVCGLLLSATLFKIKIRSEKNRYKGVSKKHNDLYFERYKGVLDVFQKTRIDSELEGEDIDKAKNVGFRVYDQGIVTYEQKKLGLSAYYDNR